MSFSEVFEELERQLNAMHLDFRRIPDNVPKQIFHYTTAEGLNGITEKQRLWASNVRFLNDLSEPKYAASVLKQSIETVKNKNKAARLTETKQLLGNFWNMAEQRVMQDPEAYVFCFCENGDLLSQWRGYAQRGRGYALGFNTTNLLNMLRPSEGQYLVSVMYNPQQQLSEAESAIERITNVLGELETSVGSISNKYGEDARRIRHRVSTALLAEVIRLQAHFKNTAFDEEREWRLVQFVHPKVNTPKIHFRESQGGIVPYLEMALCGDRTESESLLPIDSLVFGPTLDPEVTEEVLELLFSKRGYPALKVTKSVVPFRS